MHVVAWLNYSNNKLLHAYLPSWESFRTLHTTATLPPFPGESSVSSCLAGEQARRKAPDHGCSQGAAGSGKLFIQTEERHKKYPEEQRRTRRIFLKFNSFLWTSITLHHRPFQSRNEPRKTIPKNNREEGDDSVVDCRSDRTRSGGERTRRKTHH